MATSLTSAPRYIALARDIADEIARGRHPVGSRLPTELELSLERGVSRSTVRAALLRLEELGLVSRRRKSGTHVTAAAPVQETGGYVQALDSIEDLLQFASHTRRQVVHVATHVLDAAQAQELGLIEGSRWVLIESLRVPLTGEGAPLCWSENYIEASDATPELIHRLHGGNQSLIASLVAQSSGRPIAEIRQAITATGIRAGRMAEQLGCALDAHALKIIRRYVDPQGRPLALTQSYYPADRFSYTSRLQRHRPKAGL